MIQARQIVLHTGKFLTLIKTGNWEYVDRVNATGVASIIGVTTEQKVLLVEQYRIPIHARTIELPAGIIGDEPGDTHESSVAAARRELLEETGYAAGRIEAITTGPSCSGITSERVTLFRAFDLHRAGKGGGVAHEDITVHEIPLVNVVKWLEAKGTTRVLVDPKIYAGLFFITRAPFKRQAIRGEVERRGCLVRGGHVTGTSMTVKFVNAIKWPAPD